MNWSKLVADHQAQILDYHQQLKSALTPSQKMDQVLKWAQQDHLKYQLITSKAEYLECGHGDHLFAIIINDPIKQAPQLVAAYCALKLLKSSKLSIHQRLRLIILAESQDKSTSLSSYLAAAAVPSASLVIASGANLPAFTFYFPASQMPFNTTLKQLNLVSRQQQSQAQILTINWQQVYQTWKNFIQQQEVKGHLDISDWQITININSSLQSKFSPSYLLVQFLAQLKLDNSSQQFIKLLSYLMKQNTKIAFQASYQYTKGGFLQIQLLQASSATVAILQQEYTQLSQDYRIKFNSNLVSPKDDTYSAKLAQIITTAYQSQLPPHYSQIELLPSIYSATFKNSFTFNETEFIKANDLSDASKISTLVASYGAIFQQIAQTKKQDWR
ncbi:hypothetical protein [Bombilactobacillus bombi]|uniref:hypothetical protein n=1 Tax=Bombilactobacillus bombi TaxID=1303590 RepID=UPI0015E5B171|nr:hypothetical protein [Bombilactobacillus bombi]MBA1434797.1 hypothetical protein [Bombilactobacillus bombi]